MITAGLRVASSSTSGQFSAFLVPLDLPGITTAAFEDLGGRCAGRGSYYLDGVRA
jgi:cyclohexanecarboxyl-CoA dehydrogenase